MISFSKFLKERQFSQVVALLLLLLLLVIGATPGYLTGRWEWREPPRITSIKELKHLRQKGLTLPGWQTIEQRQQEIGGRKWSYQVIHKQGDQTKAVVLLLPQTGSRDLPVEWTEINSFWQWQVAQYRSANFTVKQPQGAGSNTETKVEARFFRGSTNQQTFAVLQWYAWFNGGNSSPLPWFVVDQLAQWHKKRAPWVAVSVLIPMEPLGQVEKTWNEAKSVGQTVQTALMTGPL
ncbi:cyanoexosortase B system-associated protein [Mastigocladopsis repens]|uniref:cyanoexosortase B system-associated protein n=1 Tax=Mastigocladopsis repens TaxID=221287 RepID=UPI000300B36C|nr:cyanoexosortase B system-associated protein [Mastigocladopsis repens]